MRGSVLRGCRRKAGFLCERLVIEKKKKEKKRNKQGEDEKENVFRLVCRFCDLLLFKEQYSYCKEERKRKLRTDRRNFILKVGSTSLVSSF